jgi:hypothetical protein
MALWTVYNGKKRVLMYSEGALSIPNPPSYLQVQRFSYKVPYSNVGLGGFIELDGKKFHTPSWIEVHPKTTLQDIRVDKKPFEELFVEPEKWTFESASSDKTYTVKKNKHGKLSCDCWGFIAHRKCKHVKEVELCGIS